jgi:hypothetical protein
VNVLVMVEGAVRVVLWPPVVITSPEEQVVTVVMTDAVKVVVLMIGAVPEGPTIG